ncbi:MAG: Y-family DNA polymerase [Legionella sp.]|nr:MAG: Y-family DNA polymerase [Legionella sp.]
MYALIDCNNFYASCERVFRPDLIGKAIVVLSNNDGCIIARSNEAKALGIKMGGPFFEVAALCKRHRVHVFSSNYTLYGDMSHRVMTVIEDNWSETEIYSIDEAFLNLSTLAREQQDEFCSQLQQQILRYTGMPVSIGIGPTKTLAKLANHVAKKILQIPVFNIDQQRFWLAKIAVGDVWGVGRQWDKKLIQQGIRTAQDLAEVDLRGIRDRFNVVMQRMVLELRGTPCLSLEVPEAKKSILSSRSFGKMQTAYSPVAQSISSHCARAYEKLRAQGSLVGYLTVFVKTNRHRQDLPQYHNSIGFKLVNPTDDIRYLTRCAKFCLRKIFRSGFHYQKVGIFFSDLLAKDYVQMDLFNQLSDQQLQQKEKLLTVLDNINHKYGRHTLRLAAEGHVKPWAMRVESRSPSYTTQWEDLPRVLCH